MAPSSTAQACSVTALPSGEASGALRGQGTSPRPQQAVRDLRLAELPAGPPKAQWEAPLAAAHKAQLPPGGEATAVCLAPPGSPEVMLQTRVASHLEESCMATSP